MEKMEKYLSKFCILCSANEDSATISSKKTEKSPFIPIEHHQKPH